MYSFDCLIIYASAGLAYLLDHHCGIRIELDISWILSCDRNRTRDKEVSRPGQKDLDSTKIDYPIYHTIYPSIIYIVACPSSPSYHLGSLARSFGSRGTRTRKPNYPSRPHHLGPSVSDPPNIYLTCRTVSQTSKHLQHYNSSTYTQVIYSTSYIKPSFEPITISAYYPHSYTITGILSIILDSLPN